MINQFDYTSSPSLKRLERAIGTLRHTKKTTSNEWLRELCHRKEQEAIYQAARIITAQNRRARKRMRAR